MEGLGRGKPFLLGMRDVGRSSQPRGIWAGGFSALHAAHPSHVKPWRLIVYNDEVTPGNQLAHTHPRKVQCIYFSFLELGPLLACEYCWFTATVVCSSVVNSLEGGMSKVLSMWLGQFWSNSLDITLGGISIPLLNHSRIHLFAEFGLTLSDELALHLFFMSKGSSGLKCCLFCANCFNSKTTRSSVKKSEWALLHTHHKFSDFVLHTPETIDAIVQELRDANEALSKTQRAKLETVLGYTFEPSSCLFHDELRPKITPAGHAIYDWMHVVFVGGVFNHAMFQTMHAFRKTVLTYSFIYELLQFWHWPAQSRDETGVDSFSPSRVNASKDAGTHKCTASQGRCLLPVIAAILREAVMESGHFTDAQKEFAKPILFLALAVEELEASARSAADPARFQQNAEAFLETFVRPGYKKLTMVTLERTSQNTAVFDQRLRGSNNICFLDVPAVDLSSKFELVCRQYRNQSAEVDAYSGPIGRRGEGGGVYRDGRKHVHSIRLHGAAAATIKFHMLLHFGGWLQGGYIPTCWALERKHKVAKRWITPTTNTSAAFDRSALRDCLNQHFHVSLELESKAVGLEPPVSVPPQELVAALERDVEFSYVRASLKARPNEYERIHAGDVVEGISHGGDLVVGKVLLHMEFSGRDLVALLETYPCTRSLPESTSWDISRVSYTLVPLENIKTACIYCKTDAAITVLRSPRARR